MSRVLNALVLITFALGVFGCGDDTYTGNPLSDQAGSIVGGSTFTGLPAVGALVYDGRSHCTGTVIAPRRVVTAAHCVAGFHSGKMQFVIGPSFSDIDYIIPVASMEPHPSYSSYSNNHDIGMVTLAQDAPVEPMPLLDHMDSSFVGESLFFVGYGVSNGYQQTGSGVKRAVWMEISQVNAGSFRYDPEGANTCSGDSGGPAFHRTPGGQLLLAGVTSYGDQYCVYYGVNTRVDTYKDFCSAGSSSPDPCQGETFEGRCDGDTVIWCENGQVESIDCAANGNECGWNSSAGYYDCQ